MGSQWEQYQRRARRSLRHARREFRWRRETAHPAIGYLIVGLMILLVAALAAYTLTLR